VIERDAAQFGKTALESRYEPDDDDVLCFGVSWMLIMDPATRAALGPALGAAERISARPGFRAWTDDFSDMFEILK
jgi:hypothetical protein